MQIVDILYGLNLLLIWEIKRGKSTGESAKKYRRVGRYNQRLLYLLLELKILAEL